jgi:hypothetical protein
MAVFERPISFPLSAVRAIGAGRKTLFRSVAKAAGADLAEKEVICPFGQQGDLLWVREPWNTSPPLTEPDGPVGLQSASELRIIYQADLDGRADDTHPYQVWIPGRAMPRWASRFTLLIGKTRIERLQDIGEDDLSREGGMWREERLAEKAESERGRFAQWWDSIHPRDESHWNSNPLVWVLEFKVLR